MKEYIAFFDLDNTILDSSSGELFIKYSFDNNLIGLRELIFGIYIGFIHRIGLYDTEETIKKWAMKYRGTSEKELIDFSNRWFKEIVVNHFREAAIREIDYHSSNGGKTVMLSAATTYICNPARDFLKMDDVICTYLEVADDKLTGNIVGRYCYGDEKLKRAVEYCHKTGFNIDSAFYYADSFSDIPVLERVVNPVCINPDRKLKRVAKEREWDIREW